jgi:hypothetical protein
MNWRSKPCWEYPGSRSKRGDGYGYISRLIVRAFHMPEDCGLAHRFAWTLTYGPIPKGKQVLHHCDNMPCIEPLHLFLGTRSDNMRDMVVKGRWRSGERAQRSAKAKAAWRRLEVRAKYDAINNHPDERARRSTRSKALWSRPEYRARHKAGMAAARKSKSPAPQ